MNQVKRFIGGSGKRYVEIAERGSQRMGVSVEYAIDKQHPTAGCAMVTFVVRRYNLKAPIGHFSHFLVRGPSKYRTLDTPGMLECEVTEGVSLNKLHIPLFSPAVPPYQFEQVFDQMNIWSLLAAWIVLQISKEEGFTIIVSDVATALKSVVHKYPIAEAKNVEMIMAFPDMQVEKANYQEHILDEADLDGEEDSDDEDENDKSKGYVN